MVWRDISPLLWRRMGNRSVETYAAWGIVSLVVIGALDYATGPDLEFSIFYVLPLGVVAWYSSRTLALALAVLAASAWLVASLQERSNPLPVGIALWNTGVRLAFFALLTSLLATLRDTLVRERDLARRDPLTGVANARTFMDQAEQSLYSARRYGQPLSVAFIDVDDFKHVNDSIGHQGGDEVLRVLARELDAGTRRSDVVARLGGDEFAILLPHADEQAASAVLDSLQARVERRIHDRSLPVTVSVGVATFTTPPETVDGLLMEADRLMYRVKERGKGAIAHVVL